MKKLMTNYVDMSKLVYTVPFAESLEPHCNKTLGTHCKENALSYELHCKESAFSEHCNKLMSYDPHCKQNETHCISGVCPKSCTYGKICSDMSKLMAHTVN